MARTSARSSATSDKASSPPKQTSDRQSQSPVGRRTRSLRSQSADPSENNLATTTRRGDKRSARQASVDSVSSNTSAASSRGGRTRKAIRATRSTATARDLSMVAEDRETEENEHGENVEDGEEDEGAARAQRSNSPGAMSQISGTTAISSFSARTSHSQGEIGALDPMVAEILPDLWSTSYSILDLLAPMDASENDVETTVRELKAPGSRLSKSLRYDEEKFGISRQHYGNENYIKTTLIFRRLLGSAEPDEGNFRPDAIIHAANIASLVKDFLVIQKESQSTRSILMGLDSYFPEVFVTRFEDDIRFGNSALLDESFDLALDIRTQFTIAALGFQKEQEKWDPDQILAATFYDPPQQRNASFSYFEDSLRNGQAKNIMGAGFPIDDQQNAKVLDRVRLIHSAFRQSNDAHEVGDLVDFEQLEELFPWVKFLTDLVNWSRLRFEEISRSIKQQGGVKAITNSFIGAIKNNDSSVDINYDPPPSSVIAPRQLQPPAEIIPGTSGQSLYNGDRSMVRRLEQLKRMSSTLDAPLPRQRKASATVSSPPQTKSSHEGASRTMASKNVQEVSQQEFDDFRPDMDDGYGDEPRPSAEFVQIWSNYRGDRNKENRPAPKPNTKASLLDRQPGAKRVPWNDSQDSQIGPSTQKRTREEPEREEGGEEQEAEQEEESEDEGFEQDSRVSYPGRRATAPTARRQSPRPEKVRQLAKRQRVEHPAKSAGRAAREDPRSQQQRQETASQGSARSEADHAGDDEYHPTPTFTQISAAARLNGVRSRIKNEPQKRTPWSEVDTERLINAIEEFGCSWSLIAKNVEFQHDRDQIALKDRARNMKVNYLKSGAVLPLNFENVRLGKKEIEAVKRCIPDYEP